MNFVSVENLRSTLHDMHAHGFSRLQLQDFCGTRFGDLWWDIYLVFRHLMEN
jgi:hypothetical protein